MRSVHSLLDEYGESHCNAINKTIHWICVPLIVWSVIALIWSIPSPAPWLNWAVVAVVLAQLYYFALSPRLGIGLLGYNVLSLAVCWAVELYVPAPPGSASSSATGSRARSHRSSRTSCSCSSARPS